MNTTPPNDFWRPENIRLVTQGKWLQRPTAASRPPTGISIDTRELEPGNAFLAIEGQRFDAHDFLHHAADANASLLILHDKDALTPDTASKHPDTPALLVDNTRDALLRLAAAYRRTLTNTRVIAVTGSNGKTTAVRLIHAALATKLQGSHAPNSFNNDIGLPLTILRSQPSDQYLVCEIGMNAPGEIAPLARIAAPDIAVITSIGTAHIEALGSIDNIAREKATLLAHIAPNGTAIATGDAPTLTPFLKPAPNLITFGTAEHNDLRVTAAINNPPTNKSDQPSLSFTINDRAHFNAPLPGKHNALNATAAIAVARRLGLDDPSIQQGLNNATPPPMRLERQHLAGIDIYNDAYNASPESAKAAFQTFGELTKHHQRRVVIVGDMLELGEDAPAAHTKLAEHLLESVYPLDALVTVGPMSLFTADVVSDAVNAGKAVARVAVHSDMSVEVAHRIAASLKTGDAVLLKGSRQLKLESVAEAVAAVARLIRNHQSRP